MGLDNAAGASSCSATRTQDSKITVVPRPENCVGFDDAYSTVILEYQ